MFKTVIRQISISLTRRPLSSTAIMTNPVVDNLTQKEAMLRERCFLVDENDKVIGQASKMECHLVHDGHIPLHRAFSVFLFNKHGDLLLQKRASEKITYPDHYTNSCCSHPLANIPGEEEEYNALGVKRAAIRRMNYELGIPLDSIKIEDIHYITRMIYKDEGNGRYGEHELDYILFIQQNVTIKPNPSEISEISFIPRTEFDDFVPTLTGFWTPWFSLILQHRLKLWWDHLDRLHEVIDHKKIVKLK